MGGSGRRSPHAHLDSGTGKVLVADRHLFRGPAERLVPHLEHELPGWHVVQHELPGRIRHGMERVIDDDDPGSHP